MKTLRKSITKDRGNYFERQKFRKSRKQKSSEFPEKKVQTKCFLKGKKVQKVQKKNAKSSEKSDNMCLRGKQVQKVQTKSSESSGKKFRQNVFEKPKSSESSEKKSSESSEKKKVQKVLEKSSFFLSKKFSDSIVQINFRKTKKANLIQKNICRRLKSKIKWYCEDGFLILRYTFTYNLLITCLQPLLLEIKLCNFLAKVRWNIYFPTFVTFCYVCNFFLTFVNFFVTFW